MCRDPELALGCSTLLTLVKSLLMIDIVTVSSGTADQVSQPRSAKEDRPSQGGFFSPAEKLWRAGLPTKKLEVDQAKAGLFSPARRLAHSAQPTGAR